MYINVPRAYNHDNLSQKDIDELVSKKLEKESNRFIHRWEEEKIAIENGRWGAFIRFGKNMLKLINDKGGKFAPEELSALSLEEVKKMIVAQDPKAFDKKGKKGAAAKKAAGDGTVKPTTKSAVVKKIVKKSSAKKTTLKKAASSKASPKKVVKKAGKK
jgi:DNA topoisomerase I